MAGYGEGSVRLLWIDRTRRARRVWRNRASGRSGLCCLWTHLAVDTRGQGVALNGLRSNPASTSLNERIALKLTVES